jgi:orotidine-5'-phosphate decarboxylase
VTSADQGTGRAFLGATPIVALDVPTADAALAVAHLLGESCRFYKVGSELFTAAGPGIVRALREEVGAEVFLDLKFHDIPNTVAGAVRSAASLGARLVTVHASGGRAMLDAAGAAAAEVAGDGCGVLAVTVLTSFDGPSIASAWGRTDALDVQAEVLRLAAIAADAGLHGIVCSGAESSVVRGRFGDRLALLIPGIRLAGGDTNDQRRVMTPAAAQAAGARYLILGRAVTGAADPAAAMARVLDELREGAPSESPSAR